MWYAKVALIRYVVYARNFPLGNTPVPCTIVRAGQSTKKANEVIIYEYVECI